MGRIATTIELAKASWSVLKADKELLVLPVFSGLASIVVRSPVICRGNLSSLNSSGVKLDSRTIGKEYIDHGTREEKSVVKA